MSDDRDVSTPDGPWRSALYSALVTTGPALVCRAQVWRLGKYHEICYRHVAGLAEDSSNEWHWSCEAHLMHPATLHYIRIVQARIQGTLDRIPEKASPPSEVWATHHADAFREARADWEPDPELIDHEHGVWPANKR